MPVGAGPVKAAVALTGVAWGTKLDLTCSYASVGAGGSGYDEDTLSAYALVVHTREGATEQVATWKALPGRTMRLTGATATGRTDITTVEVRTTEGRVAADPAGGTSPGCIGITGVARCASSDGAGRLTQPARLPPLSQPARIAAVLSAAPGRAAPGARPVGVVPAARDRLPGVRFERRVRATEQVADGEDNHEHADADQQPQQHGALLALPTPGPVVVRLGPRDPLSRSAADGEGRSAHAGRLRRSGDRLAVWRTSQASRITSSPPMMHTTSATAAVSW